MSVNRVNNLYSSCTRKKKSLPKILITQGMSSGGRPQKDKKKTHQRKKKEIHTKGKGGRNKQDKSERYAERNLSSCRTFYVFKGIIEQSNMTTGILIRTKYQNR